jgi:hypothetical protein
MGFWRAIVLSTAFGISFVFDMFGAVILPGKLL